MTGLRVGLAGLLALASSCARYGIDDFRADAYVPAWTLPSSNPWATFSLFAISSGFEDIRWQAVRIPEYPEVQSQAEHLAGAGLGSGTLWLVELPGPESVALVSALSRASVEPIAPVLTFGNWPADDEVVPMREVTALLNRTAPRLPLEGQRSTPVFVLDSQRLKELPTAFGRGFTDNRYSIAGHNLPSPEFLARQQINRVVYLVSSDRSLEEDDLNGPMVAWQIAGIQLVRLDVAKLSTLPAKATAEQWATALEPMQVVWREPTKVTTLADKRITPPGIVGNHSGTHMGGMHIGR